VLGGCWVGRGVLWVSSGEGRGVVDVQAAGEEDQGVRGAAASPPPSSRAWVGAEGTGFDQGTVQRQGNRVAASWNSAPQ
jgi:hypothetical protein